MAFAPVVAAAIGEEGEEMIRLPWRGQCVRTPLLCTPLALFLLCSEKPKKRGLVLL
jgi:hypothetical protein